jgi:hypothetical protein
LIDYEKDNGFKEGYLFNGKRGNRCRYDFGLRYKLARIGCTDIGEQ